MLWTTRHRNPLVPRLAGVADTDIVAQWLKLVLNGPSPFIRLLRAFALIAGLVFVVRPSAQARSAELVFMVISKCHVWIYVRPEPQMGENNWPLPTCCTELSSLRLNSRASTGSCCRGLACWLVSLTPSTLLVQVSHFVCKRMFWIKYTSVTGETAAIS